MGGLESFFSVIGTWFGFVGSCVAGSGSACRPFLAFVAITAAAGVALALLVMAYRALKHEQAREIESQQSRARELQSPAPVRRQPSRTIVPPRAAPRGWQVTA